MVMVKQEVCRRKSKVKYKARFCTDFCSNLPLLCIADSSRLGWIASFSTAMTGPLISSHLHNSYITSQSDP